MTRIFAHRSTTMPPLSSVSRKIPARYACVALMATLLLLSCVSKSSDQQSNKPHVNSGPTQASAHITGAEGGKVDFAGIATLIIPPGAISSTTASTVSITQVPLPMRVGGLDVADQRPRSNFEITKQLPNSLG
jgi:hypothetical protein